MTAPNTQDMKRLQAALNSHRRKAEALGLPADDVRAHQLLAKADRNEAGDVLCYKLGTVLTFDPKEPQAPNKATVGHIWPLSEKSGCEADMPHPGHTLDNLALESWESNSADNHENATPIIASQKRHTPDKERGVKRKGKGRGFQKPAPDYISPLSKKARELAKERMS